MTWFEIIYLLVQFLALLTWVALPLGLWLIKTKRVRTIFLGAVLVINTALVAFFMWDQRAVPTVNTSVESGDFWDIETVFQAEPNVSSRAWKRNILEELFTNLNNYRRQNNLAEVRQGTVESFSPEQLSRILAQNTQEVQLLDVRETYERNSYGLPGSVAYRYGDLANDIKPNLDPAQKVVVVCYSGIRGYLVANLLTQMGFEQAGFIRGGLEAWHEAGLPAAGDYDDFEFLSQVYDRLSEEEVAQQSNLKIDFRANVAPSNVTFLNTKIFNGELSTAAEVNQFMNALQTNPVTLLCETESECYDARMFAYNYEALGGKVLGYYEF